MNAEDFTFVSSAHKTCSWLDHVVTTHTGFRISTSIKLRKDFITSNHIPMYMELDFKCNDIVNNMCIKSKPKVDWLSLDANAIKASTSQIMNILARASLDFDLMTCTNAQFNNVKHQHTID